MKSTISYTELFNDVFALMADLRVGTNRSMYQEKLKHINSQT